MKREKERRRKKEIKDGRDLSMKREAQLRVAQGQYM